MSFAEACRNKGPACVAARGFLALGNIPASPSARTGTDSVQRQSSLAKAMVRLSLEYH